LYYVILCVSSLQIATRCYTLCCYNALLDALALAFHFRHRRASRSRLGSRRRRRGIGGKLARHRRPERGRPRTRTLRRFDVFIPASRESRVLQSLGDDAVVKRELESLFTIRERFRDVQTRVARSKRRARLVQGGDGVFISPERPPRAHYSSKQGHRVASGHERASRSVSRARIGRSSLQHKIHSRDANERNDGRLTHSSSLSLPNAGPALA